MIKITDLTETRRRTVHVLDEYGNRERDVEEFIAIRPVRSIDSGVRFGHFIVDSIAFQIFMYFVGYLLEVFINLANPIVTFNLTLALFGAIVSLLLYPTFYAFCEYNWQRTPGKYLSKSLVIDEYGNKPDLRAIILRSFIRLVPFEAFSCFGDNYSHGWHDSWSKTWVVTEEELVKLRKLQLEQSEMETGS